MLNEHAIGALGAISLTEVLQRLRPMAQSATGSDPIILLNGKRLSDFAELAALPPEALERTEILSEEDAPRFGYPPTVRLINFVTKKHFGQRRYQRFIVRADVSPKWQARPSSPQST